VSLPDLLDELGERHINELHLEAGRLLNTSFLREGLVDELLIYLAPTLLGQGLGLTALGPFESLDQGQAWRHVDALNIGPDLRLRLRRA
jgi:diaminohydroxyphosphoribosylaminopyrimidine deaminase/5-amino-6-(5-phosphoribosylamino)uracil reductase